MRDNFGNELAIGDSVAVAQVGTLSWSEIKKGVVNSFTTDADGTDYAYVKCGNSWSRYRNFGIMKL